MFDVFDQVVRNRDWPELRFVDGHRRSRRVGYNTSRLGFAAPLFRQLPQVISFTNFTNLKRREINELNFPSEQIGGRRSKRHER